MGLPELLLVALAGGAAGLINTVVGSGTLVTFSTLLALGVPPVVANISNSVGLTAGGVSAVVPVLIGLGCVLVLLQPTFARRVAARHSTVAQDEEIREPGWAFPAVVGSSVYGGYFGAAQGVLLLAILGLGLPHESMARINAVENGLGTIVNGIAAVVFVGVSFVGGPPIDWLVAAAVAAGSIVGAQVGARVGRWLPPVVYRVVIVVIGVGAIVNSCLNGVP